MKLLYKVYGLGKESDSFLKFIKSEGYTIAFNPIQKQGKWPEDSQSIFKSSIFEEEGIITNELLYVFLDMNIRSNLESLVKEYLCHSLNRDNKVHSKSK